MRARRGAIALASPTPVTIDSILSTVRRRLLQELKIDDYQGRRLLDGCPVIQAP